MQRRILVQRDDTSFDLVEEPAPDEFHLQEVLKSHPSLIPASDLGLEGDLLVVGRETALASGYIDLLCISRSGEIILIEFKTGPQNPDFRHALAQLVDYGSDLWQLTLEEFDRGVVQRYLTSPRRSSEFEGARDLAGVISRSGWALSIEESDALGARLSDVLASGDFHYVVAAQRFTEAMTRSLDYLNTTMRFGRFYLIEVIRLAGANLVAHAAEVVAAPPRRRGVSNAERSVGLANEADYLAGLDDEGYREALKDLFATVTALGLTVKWRSRGFSIGVDTPDRDPTLSVCWGLPPDTHWQGARHLTLGVDPESLKQTPSVTTEVAAFVERISLIPGGRRLTGKLQATTFEPAVVASAIDEIESALTDLVTSINSSGA